MGDNRWVTVVCMVCYSGGGASRLAPGGRQRARALAQPQRQRRARPPRQGSAQGPQRERGQVNQKFPYYSTDTKIKKVSTKQKCCGSRVILFYLFLRLNDCLLQRKELWGGASARRVAGGGRLVGGGGEPVHREDQPAPRQARPRAARGQREARWWVLSTVFMSRIRSIFDYSLRRICTIVVDDSRTI